MCTIVATILGSTLLLLSIVFIGANGRMNEGGRYGASSRFTEREVTERPTDEWELISADTVTPTIERMVHYDELRREKLVRGFESMLDEDLNAENSHVVVQVYSVNSEQEESANRSSSSSPGSPIRSMKVHKYGKPKDLMDGRATDRVERKVFAPVRNIQDQMATEESGELQQQDQQAQPQEQKPIAKEALLEERFYVDDSLNREPSRRPYYGANKDDVSEGFELEPHQPPRSQAIAPFYDYSEQTNQRMLDEFFALRNQDSLASRRSNYDWDEGQFPSRTLEEINNQHRASGAGLRKKVPPFDYRMESSPSSASKAIADTDMGYDRYAEFAAEMEQRMARGFGPQKLGRRQRATHYSGAGNPTHVLNRTPIVSTDGDYSAPPLAKGSPIERSRFHYTLPSMVFNPYAWDPYHLNMLRFPQCNACQQHARALCGKCGMCGDCCAHSKCTCGCLNG